MDIVELSAKQGGGKTTTATELVRIATRLGYNFAGSYKFAEPLYEIHNFIVNKVSSYEKMAGRDRLKKDLASHLAEYVINKMESFGLGRPEAILKDADKLTAYFQEYVDRKIATDTVHETGKDGKLLQYIGTEIGRTYYGINVWVDIMKNKLEKLKSPEWSILKRLVIIDDCRFENEFDAFPEALRVRLRCPEEIRKQRAESWREDVNHPSEIGLDKYDAEGRFDLYLETDKVNTADCATLIAAQLQKNSWAEKRKEFVDALEKI